MRRIFGPPRSRRFSRRPPVPAFYPAFYVPLCVLFLNLAPVFPLGRGDNAGSAPPPGVPSGPPAGAPGPALSVPGPSGAPVREGDWLELEGLVRLIGGEPFTDLVLTGADGQDWYLEGPARRLLRACERQNVRVRGRVELREMVLANGRSLGLRRGLSDVTLLASRHN
jgi:hypothetical protein